MNSCCHQERLSVDWTNKMSVIPQRPAQIVAQLELEELSQESARNLKRRNTSEKWAYFNETVHESWKLRKCVLCPKGIRINSGHITLSQMSVKNGFKRFENDQTTLSTSDGIQERPLKPRLKKVDIAIQYLCKWIVNNSIPFNVLE